MDPKCPLRSWFAIFLFLTPSCVCHRHHEATDQLHHEETDMVLDISMPHVKPTHNDAYICTAKNVESLGTRYIHKFEPNSNSDVAHHMLLYTIDNISAEHQGQDFWDCANSALHGLVNLRVIYAWAKNAPSTTLPKNVAFRIGPDAGIKNLILQVHYVHALPEGVTDSSGFKLHVSTEEPQYLAGMYQLSRRNLTIPPHQEYVHGDINCAHKSQVPIHPFAFRVHTHGLGSVVSGYLIQNGKSDFIPIAKGNPQWPQAFYAINGDYTIHPKDLLIARCNFNTTNFPDETVIGPTAHHEMCSLYLMFYTESRDTADHFIRCINEEFPQISRLLPPESDQPLPRNETLEAQARGVQHGHG